MLVGGLGLGLTARAVLADPRVRHVDVVELAPPLVGWARAGLVAELAGLEGERCTLHVADVLDVLGGRCAPRGPWDVVLLDVDNGPDFLVHASNAALYAAARRSPRPARRWRPGGLLVVWSSHVAPALLTRPCARSPGTVTRSARTSSRSSGRAAASGMRCTRSRAPLALRG